MEWTAVQVGETAAQVEGGAGMVALEGRVAQRAVTEVKGASRVGAVTEEVRVAQAAQAGEMAVQVVLAARGATRAATAVALAARVEPQVGLAVMAMAADGEGAVVTVEARVVPVAQGDLLGLADATAAKVVKAALAEIVAVAAAAAVVAAADIVAVPRSRTPRT